MDPALPDADAVAVVASRIAAVGANSDVLSLAGPATQIVDCQGRTLLPGFNDAHCHLLGLGRRLQDVDCGHHRICSISGMQRTLREKAAVLAPGRWLRGFGYDEQLIEEGRHPNRWDLDAVSREVPIWIEHRSGHACVLNSLALSRAGISLSTPEPPAGVIDREPTTGEPTGVLFEMNSFLRQQLGVVRKAEEFEEGMRAAGHLLASYGITSAQDAGPNNGVERWGVLRDLQSAGILRCRITMFAGVHRLEELSDAGLSHGFGDDNLRLGHAKIILTLTSGSLHPSPDELGLLIADAHERGFPVAIHCIEEEAIEAAASAIGQNLRPGLHDRLEHCAEATPRLVREIKYSGARVVTQPGFIFHNGLAYRERVNARLLPHLYPTGSLVRSGVQTAFSSDAPVIDPNPWPALQSAVTRHASDGLPLCGDQDDQQRLPLLDALRMYTLHGAMAEGAESRKGSISVGKLADLTLVDTALADTDTSALAEVRVALTIVAGEVVWGKG